METYVCTKFRLYNWLSDAGFVPYKTVRDFKNCKYWVWLYDKTPELLDSIDNYYKSF